MPRLPVFLFVAALALVVAVLAAACDGGEKAPPPTSEATSTASPPSPTPTPTPTAQEVEETVGRYENAELGLAFNYPDQWQTTEEFSFQEAVLEPEEVVLSLLVGDPRSEQLHGIIVQVGVNNLETEDEFILALEDLFAQAAGTALEVGETDAAELAGMPARRFAIDFEFGGTVPSISEQLIAFSPGLTFHLICEAPRERFAEIRIGCQTVIDSFEFTPEQ